MTRRRERESGALDVNAVLDGKRVQAYQDFRAQFKIAARKAAALALTSGVDFGRVHDANFAAFYGGRSVPDMNALRGLPEGGTWLDRAGAAELAANTRRLVALGRALERMPCSGADEMVSVARAAGGDFRRVFHRYNGQYPEKSFGPVEPLRDVEARLRAGKKPRIR